MPKKNEIPSPKKCGTAIHESVEIEAEKMSVIFVEEHIPCHKGAYTGKSGITRDRTGKPWYYRNSKR